MTGSYMIITLTFKKSLGKAKQMMFKQMCNSRSEVFCKYCVLEHFAKFTGKHLCQSLFVDFFFP